MRHRMILCLHGNRAKSGLVPRAKKSEGIQKHEVPHIRDKLLGTFVHSPCCPIKEPALTHPPRDLGTPKDLVIILD